MKTEQFDFLIIGSGFGGSVSAMRLAQKGYKVAVLESGKRWLNQNFAKTNWQIRKFLWLPLFGCFGIQAIRWLKGVMVLHGRGVGGGSLVYAATLMQPSKEIFEKDWPGGIDWNGELSLPYEKAKKMLGVNTNAVFADSEKALLKLAEKMGVPDSFHPTEVGIYFGKETLDPYFGGKGPTRSGCIGCGGCMVGCRYNSKNTLDKNYLYFAELWGTQIFAETAAEKITPAENGFLVETISSTRVIKSKRTFHAKNVILAAGVLGSVELLLKNKFTYKTLPEISDQLGNHVRTNGESLLGATSLSNKKDYSQGVAIGAAFHPNDYTKIEAVKYPKGSDFMRLLAVPLTENGTRITRPLKMLVGIFKNLRTILRLMLIRDWAQSTVILLVMQNIDQGMKLFLKRGRMQSETLGNNPVPSYIPVAQTAAAILAKDIGGVPQNIISEVMFATPATAHILGGCRMDHDVNNGVIDSQHRVFNYPGLFVCDGSVIAANLGVNPSLTITALAERFTEQFPVQNEELAKLRQL